MSNNVDTKDPAAKRESFTDLLLQLVNNSAAMIHDEIELAIQGVREKIRVVSSAVLTVATGVIISFAACLSFCASLIIGLSSYMAPVVAALVTGAALGLIGGITFLIGYRKLKQSILKI